MMSYLDPYNFYFELPLYLPIEITPDQIKSFSDLVSYTGKIDGYNPRLKEPTTFSVRVFRVYSTGDFTPSYYDKTTKAILGCLRSGEEFEYFFKTFRKKDQGNYFLIKLGQYPSIADLHISQIKDYSKVLSEEKLKELTRAIGLAANGVGIGSFIYLRRIFEFLISEAYQKERHKEGWNDDEFWKSRMNDKVQLLASQLPEFLVEHKELYGILSKGVHELEEKECLAYFLPVRTGIELILDDRIIELEKAEKRRKASLAIKGILGGLSG